MRAWAFSDAEVRTVQERVDSQRLESLYGIWSKILDDSAQAHTAALLPYLVGIGPAWFSRQLHRTSCNAYTNCC